MIRDTATGVAIALSSDDPEQAYLRARCAGWRPRSCTHSTTPCECDIQRLGTWEAQDV